MHIGIPREIKPLEGRVALLPDACRQLVNAGHHVLLERDAGMPAGYPDAGYVDAGAQIVGDHTEVFAEDERIMKVKEPQPAELELLRPEHRLFSFLHLAAEPELTERLQAIGLTAVGFETVEEENGNLPVLAPMSDIAGDVPRPASQVLSAVLTPNVQALAKPGWKAAKPLSRGINIEAGIIRHPAFK